MEMNKRIIVFAPHPDDETLGCGGTIAKKISEGYEVIIVVMTDGRYALSKVLGINSDPTPEELKEIREEELKRAVGILGVSEENIVFLDFEDGTLEKNEEKAEQKIMEILSKYNTVEVYFPYKRDHNPDHRATNRIVKKSIEKLGLLTLKCQYSISQKFSRIGPMIDMLIDVFKHNTISVNISQFLPLKEAAVREFESEITIISKKQERPIIKKIEEFLKGEEMFIIDK